MILRVISTDAHVLPFTKEPILISGMFDKIEVSNPEVGISAGAMAMTGKVAVVHQGFLIISTNSYILPFMKEPILISGMFDKISRHSYCRATTYFLFLKI